MSGFNFSSSSPSTTSPSFSFGSSSMPSSTPAFSFGSLSATITNPSSAPTFGFGTPSSAPSLFGSVASSAASSLFGSAASSGAAPSFSGAVSSASSSAPTSTPFFGSVSTSASSPFSGVSSSTSSLFGSSSPSKPLFGLFGSSSSTTTTASMSFSTSTTTTTTAATPFSNLFSSSSTPSGFSLTKPTTTATPSATSAALLLTQSSSSFSFGTTSSVGFSNSASAAAATTTTMTPSSSTALAVTMSAKPTSPLFSTVTTTTTTGSSAVPSSASTPSFSLPAFASASAASSAAAVGSFPGFASATASSGAAGGASFPGFSLSTKASSSPATNSQTQSTTITTSAAAGPLFGYGEKRIEIESKLLSGIMAKLPIIPAVLPDGIVSKAPPCLWPVPRSKILTLTASLATALPWTSDAEPSAQRRKIDIAMKLYSGKEVKGIKKEPDSRLQSNAAAFEARKEIIPTGTSTSTSAGTIASSSSATASQTLSLAVASSRGTTSSAITTVSAAPKLPSEITGKTVEEIIKEWNAELQERTGKFRKQAAAIAEWDKRILQNRDVLLRLEIEVAKVVETQANLERQLELIETHQQEVDKALESIEEEAERIYKDERGLLLDDEAASTRDAMYEQAESVERELEQMTEQVKSVIQTLNANQGGELDAIDGMTPLDVVVRILNNQLSSLMWIDEKAEEFSSRIQKIATQGSAVDRSLTSPKFW